MTASTTSVPVNASNDVATGVSRSLLLGLLLTTVGISLPTAAG
jgi:hypothetical protein